MQPCRSIIFREANRLHDDMAVYVKGQLYTALYDSAFSPFRVLTREVVNGIWAPIGSNLSKS